MRTFKNVRKNINSNNWLHKNREEEIKKEIDKLVPPNVPIKFLKDTRIGTEMDALHWIRSFKELQD